jgi:riboflavin kinase/FMN adenylyltransferase
MQIISSFSAPVVSPTVATIGLFDGVHLGHRYLLKQVVSLAQQLQLKPAVITFDRHPRTVTEPGFVPQLLCNDTQKVDKLAETGIKLCISLPFDTEMAQMDYRDFMHQILQQKLNVDTLVVGYDHRFGKRGEHHSSDYRQYGNLIGMKVVEAAELPSAMHVSSSQIRKALLQGKVLYAAQMLSYPYCLEGNIVQGDGLGRQIGFPTANLHLFENQRLLPADGVYATFATVEGDTCFGMTYIGKRPTVKDDGKSVIETHLFDFEGDIYGKTMQIEFVDFIRSEQRFVSQQALKKQLIKDREAVRKIFE